ncbi:MAG: CopG family transcriptional regulator [Longimicrobiaceae bacterium]
MADLEKLTINLTPVDLGLIELLVEQGFYSNRAEFIRIAIRDQLAKHADTLRDTATRQAYVIGALIYGRGTLEEARSAGKRIAIRVVGLLSIGNDVTPELAREVIESVSVHGIFKASRAVKDALADRTR